jgi:hypothetical protein
VLPVEPGHTGSAPVIEQDGSALTVTIFEHVLVHESAVSVTVNISV